MSCSRSLSLHLLRGAGAVALLVLGLVYADAMPWLLPMALAGAVVLLRGCPMCWLMGLFEAMSKRQRSTSNIAGRRHGHGGTP